MADEKIKAKKKPPVEKKPVAKKTDGKKTAVKKTQSAIKKLKILITVVNKSKAEYYMDLIQGYEVNMQLALPAKGTANAEMLNLLGLVGSEKVVIISAVREDNVKALTDELAEKFATVRNGRGIAYTIPMSSIIGVAVYGFLSNNKQTVKE